MPSTWDITDPRILTEKFSILLQLVHDVEGSDSEADAIDAVVLHISDLGYANVMISLLHETERPAVIRGECAFGEEWEKIKEETVREYPGPDILAKTLASGEAEFIADSRTHPDTEKGAVDRSGIVSQYVIPLSTREMRIGTMQVHLGVCHKKPDLQCRMLDALATHLALAISRFRALRRLEDAHEQILAHSRLAIGSEVATAMMHQLKGDIVMFQADLKRMLEDRRNREHPVVFPVLRRLLQQIGTWGEKVEKPLAFMGIEEEVRTFSLTALLTEIVDYWYDIATANKCRIKMVEYAHDLSVHIRRSYIREVMSCLIVNTIQAHAHNVKITVKAAVDYFESGDDDLYAVISVADDGQGIDPSKVEQIFNLGFTTKPRKGTGVGLFIAKRLADSMSGDIRVVSIGKPGGHRMTEFELAISAEDGGGNV